MLEIQHRNISKLTIYKDKYVHWQTHYIFPTALNCFFNFLKKSKNLKLLRTSPNAHSTDDISLATVLLYS